MNAFVNDNLKKRLLKPPFYFFSNLHSSIEVEKRGIKDGRGKPFSLSVSLHEVVDFMLREKWRGKHEMAAVCFQICTTC